MAKIDTNDPLNIQLNAMVDAGSRKMSAFREMARDATRYIYGDQHSGRERKKNWSYPVMNRMYADMQQEIAILSANNPRIATLPREDTDIEVAKSVGQALKGEWIDGIKMRLKVVQGLLDDKIVGIKIAKCIWEPKVEWDEDKAAKTGDGWRGRIEVNIINPRYFGCDPNVELAVDIPTKARFLHTERWVDMAWAAQRWPEYGEYLKEKGIDLEGPLEDTSGGGSRSDETNFNRDTNAWAGKEVDRGDEKYFQARLADVIIGENNVGDQSSRPARSGMAKVQEIYFKDYATEDVDALKEPWPPGEGDAAHIFQDDGDVFFSDRNKPIKAEDGSIIGYEQVGDDWPEREVRPAYKRPLYPNGRMVIRLDDEFIVEDRAWEYKVWPFAVSPHYLLPHMWHGVNYVELSRGFQDWMNRIASNLTNYIEFFGNPQLWVEKDALMLDDSKKKGSVPNWAGAVLKFAKGALTAGKARIITPPPLPSAIFQIFDIFKENDQDLKGVHDVVQGRASKGSQTLGELDMLNRNTRQRLALQGAILDEWLRQIAHNIIELMQANYQVGDWVRWSGDEPESVRAAIMWTQEMADAVVDIQLEPISTLPYNEEQEIGKYVAAFNLAGPAMLEDVLKKMNIQNIPDILEKHEIIGPLMKLMELSAENGMGPQELIAAIQAQLQLLQQSGQPEGAGGAPQQPTKAPTAAPAASATTSKSAAPSPTPQAKEMPEPTPLPVSVAGGAVSPRTTRKRSRLRR